MADQDSSTHEQDQEHPTLMPKMSVLNPTTLKMHDTPVFRAVESVMGAVVNRQILEAVSRLTPDWMDKITHPFKVATMSSLGKLYLPAEKELQEKMNNKLFMNTVDPESGKEMMAEVSRDYLEQLFPHGKQDEWPQQLIVCGKDIRVDPAALRKQMFWIEGVVNDATGHTLDVPTDFDAPTAGKTVVIGAYDTRRDTLANGALVTSRIEQLKKDPLSLKHICPSAETAGQMLLDLATLENDSGVAVLRDDAPEIFRHVMTHGFSHGGNIATDIFRYIRHELRSGKYELALDEKGTQTETIQSDAQVKQILGGAHIYVIGAADIAYDKDELQCMPPRDHSRSNGDMMIAGVAGPINEMGNYNRGWDQQNNNHYRNDRLLETIAPKKRLFGILGSDDGYHGALGHSEDHYRTSVLEFGAEELAERWLPRFHDYPLAGNITFQNGMVELEFDQGTKSKAMDQAMEKFTEALAERDVTVISEVFPPNPYHLSIQLNRNEDTLGAIRDSMDEAGILPSREVFHALNMEQTVGWLKERLGKLPDAHIAVVNSDEGPMVRINPSTRAAHAVGGHLHRLLNKGLERIGIETRDRRTIDGSAVEVPLHDVVSAIKGKNQQEIVESMGR